MTTNWRGPYRGGELEIQATDLESLNKQLDELHGNSSNPEQQGGQTVQVELPGLTGNLGCFDAVRQALGSPWGRAGLRTMTELQQVFEANALFYSPGSLSGSLNYLTKTGELRRLDRNGKWAYTLASRSDNEGK